MGIHEGGLACGADNRRPVDASDAPVRVSQTARCVKATPVPALKPPVRGRKASVGVSSVAGLFTFSGPTPESTRALKGALEALVAAHVAGHLIPLEPLATRVWRRVRGRVVDEDVADLRALFVRSFAARLLCVTRVGPCGAEALNRQVARALLARRGLDPWGGVAAGEPIVVTRNDPERGLWNGDPGLCLLVQDAPEPGAPPRPPRRVFAFPRGPGYQILGP